jgi:molybdenum cofactor cytidylyltransferase
MSVVAVLLAAGGASRFRSSAEKNGLTVGHKLFAPLRGETVFSCSLRNLLDAAAEGAISEVIVVQGALDLTQLVREVVGSRTVKVRVVTNPDWAQGQATSLALAIDTITKPRLGVEVGVEGGVDLLPQSLRQAIPQAMVVGLGDQPFIPASTWAALANEPFEKKIVVATYNGLRRNPVRIDAELWEEIPRTGDEGARPLLRSRPELVSELPCDGDPADIDTVEDLLRWS